MSILQTLKTRSNNRCELCSTNDTLQQYTLPPAQYENVDNDVLICATCAEQVQENTPMDINHWRCLNDSMWSEHEAVKILTWRLLHRIKKEGWPQDLLDMMYLEEASLNFAKATGEHEEASNKIVHRDTHGAILQAGDSVVLIKDLKVKGTSMVAKQGTAVRNIRLDHDNAQYIEGKVGGQHIVIITHYVKKI